MRDGTEEEDEVEQEKAIVGLAPTQHISSSLSLSVDSLTP